MLTRRATLVLVLMVTAVVITAMGFSDKSDKSRKSCDIHRIDNCARNGGLR